MNFNKKKEIDLFLNGIPPSFKKNFLNKKIFAVDGAYSYLKKYKIPIDYLSGDFDSFLYKKENILVKKSIFNTYNQKKTDFEKALTIIIEKGFNNVNVWGASGKEQDHFLGNLSTALKYKKEISIIFYDYYHSYFFLEKKSKLFVKKNKKISLFPFPSVLKLKTKGLKYNINNTDMEIGKNIGIRNKSVENYIEILYKKGELLIFIEN
ncbi:thiamine diphosphokinase [Blattabacterium cuenoti]|uniref:thiamine diphosphokinase n=1 Tax=Blattabacterium cuenoti TaxID=1653831 RepID=UPI00163CB061|nr:thiamine diphosphokinase [Blattabacterium cuenoti]